MASPLLSLPREVRDMISEIVIIQTDQPFRLQAQHLGPKKSTAVAPHVGGGGANLAILCKQLHAEYFSLLKRAAFASGTRTLIPIHDFDFTHLTAFVHTLREHEIAAAKRNANFVVSLVVLDPAAALLKQQQQQQQSLREWTRVCEATGFEVEYTVQWSALDLDVLRQMEGLVGRTREGRKILQGLRWSNVKGWTWDAYQASLRSGERGKKRSCG